MKILFSGGQYFDGTTLQTKDVLIEDGIIAEIGDALRSEGAEIVNGTGMVLSPGFCDLHVHLREPGFAQKETIASGTAAAAAGGFTTVCAMPNLNPVPDSLQNLDPQLKLIERDARVRVLPYGAITVGQEGGCLADIEVLADFVCGFTDDGKGVQHQDTMRKAMKMVAIADSFVAAHCEDESLIAKGAVCVQENSAFAKQHGWIGVSNQSEWQEVERDIALAEETGCHLHICHASTAQTFALVRDAKARGVHVTCEATPHNLLLSCDDISEDSGCFRMNPPLRTKQDVKAAQEALQNGTIDCIATDHAPHADGEKLVAFGDAANGVVGLETAFAACYTGLVQTGIIGLEKLLTLLTSTPRGILKDKTPAIAPGAVANLTLLDINLCQTVDPQQFLTKGLATPFAGVQLTGWPVLTLCEGHMVYRR